MENSRNIIICSAGTDNRFGRHNTNVVRLFQALDCGENQKCFYDPGVGTYSPAGKIRNLFGKAFGTGLQRNIEDAYRYLMSTYIPGGRIYLFGFSRGAFTVRCLAGMLHKCGLLEKGADNLVSYASRIYNKNYNRKTAAAFKQTYCRKCVPYFIGVWDTAASLGYFPGKKFFDEDLHGKITYGYQAAAIDEKRKKFPISLWNENNITPDQTIEQVWFPGVHCDVGGYYKERGLSDGALQWIIHKAESAVVQFKDTWQQNVHPDPTAQNALHNSRTWFWKLWKPIFRTIPENALIHRSDLDRINANIGYNPKNLPKSYTVTPRPKTPNDPKHLILNTFTMKEITAQFIRHEGLRLTPYRCPARGHRKEANMSQEQT